MLAKKTLKQSYIFQKAIKSIAEVDIRPILIFIYVNKYNLVKCNKRPIDQKRVVLVHAWKADYKQVFKVQVL